MNRHQSPSRTGWSLLELVLVITMLGVLTTMAGQMLTIFFETDSRTLSETSARLGMDRLANQFRMDIHQASEVSIESPQRIRIQTPTAAIIFEAAEQTVLRSIPERLTKDRFKLADDVTCQFEEADNLVKLICTRNTDTLNAELKTSIQRDVESSIKTIVAVPGWDLRFTGREGGQ